MPHRAADMLGHDFSDPELVRKALTHASVADHRLDSNERMEFLGDAVLGYVVCEHLFQSFPELQEGELTKIKSAVVSRRVCAIVAEELGLSGILILGKGMGGASAIPSSVAAGALESVIAAIYLDGGIEPARKAILQWFQPHIDEAAASSHQQNFKSALQQWSQKHLPDVPTYLLLDEKGPDHSKCFEVCVEIGGRRFPSAWARSKKEAEQLAAEAALKVLTENEAKHPAPVTREPAEEPGEEPPRGAPKTLFED